MQDRRVCFVGQGVGQRIAHIRPRFLASRTGTIDNWPTEEGRCLFRVFMSQNRARSGLLATTSEKSAGGCDGKAQHVAYQM